MIVASSPGDGRCTSSSGAVSATISLHHDASGVGGDIGSPTSRAFAGTTLAMAFHASVKPSSLPTNTTRTLQCSKTYRAVSGLIVG